ncbi:unnamed protein product [Zymoseptoria tritici ST99CH_3D7]|uniref:Uncharacterized protein n=1 Tax=Zymoseptoria tritici (strain ST99CH_3D7) TaxID=1276538 RepID=A0A1X7RXK5_ZYMT9|nr:unnamed protein product [Zymoseptoria tritici ST99CH_3D7]
MLFYVTGRYTFQSLLIPLLPIFAKGKCDSLGAEVGGVGEGGQAEGGGWVDVDGLESDGTGLRGRVLRRCYEWFLGEVDDWLRLLIPSPQTASRTTHENSHSTMGSSESLNCARRTYMVRLWSALANTSV